MIWAQFHVTFSVNVFKFEFEFARIEVIGGSGGQSPLSPEAETIFKNEDWWKNSDPPPPPYAK